MHRTAIPALLAFGLAAPAFADPGHDHGDPTHTWGERNTDLQPVSDSQFRAPLIDSGDILSATLIAGDLEHPWGIDQLPDGGFLVTERPGRMRHVTMDGQVSEPLAGLPDIFNEASEMGNVQAGLLDVHIGPEFETDRMVYFTYSKAMGDGQSATAAARGVLSDDMTELTDVEDIWVQDPPSDAAMHYGSRLAFADDGTVFITTGEHFTQEYREFAQDLDNTYGKIVRVNLDGSIPEDNPFVGQEGDDAIWSYGHRNVQAAAITSDGTLMTIEHGPAGGDELNAPESGKNYGWPVVSYGQQYSGGPIGSGEAQQDGMEQPVYFWDPVIAPSGMDFVEGGMFPEWEGSILTGSLYPGGVVRLDMAEDGTVAHEERVLTDQGRVRDIDMLDDGSFVFLTDFENGSIMHVTRKGEGS